MLFSFGNSRLKQAIKRGLENGEIQHELRELGELTLKSRADADAVCWGLRQICGGKTTDLVENAQALICLFQEVDGVDCAAFDYLQQHGLPELLRVYDLLQSSGGDEASDAQFSILKMLALYGTTEGTFKVIEAAQQPLRPDAYMWSVILGCFKSGHPQNEILYPSLSDPLPVNFIGVSLLDAANACLIEGESMRHPFDSDAGVQRLRNWLTDSEPDKYSYAHSAAAALPFINHAKRDELLRLAMIHPNMGVRLEAAWASAKLGQPEGLDYLVKYCLDSNHAQMAKRYLSDVGREDLIPASAKAPDFEALAEFAQWLAHPNELGRHPDTLEIVDHRQLAWPPERELKPFWLIKYRAKDDTGLEPDQEECGLVGSVTFCFFSYKLVQRPPEDAYAVHCYWEMEHAGLIAETDVRNNQEEFQSLLAEWRGQPLRESKIKYLAEIAPELKYPQRIVALASAHLANEAGWVVLDGERSEWYPQSDMPSDTFESVVLKIHVGRRLLGFQTRSDRKKYLMAPHPPKPDAEIASAYEKLLATAQSKSGKAQQEALNHFGPIGKHLETYALALKRLGRADELRQVIALLSPYWDNCAGHAKLGEAAYHGGLWDLAEARLLRYKNECEKFHRSEEMKYLAEIWLKNGKTIEAQKLLLDCLHLVLRESQSAKGSDVELFEKWFQAHRAALLTLFPEECEDLLAANDVPSSTLR